MHRLGDESSGVCASNCFLHASPYRDASRDNGRTSSLTRHWLARRRRSRKCLALVSLAAAAQSSYAALHQNPSRVAVSRPTITVIKAKNDVSLWDDDADDSISQTDSILFSFWKKGHMKSWDLVESIATYLLSEESAKAVKMVRKIITRFGDHGVVDVFNKYPRRDVVTSIRALSRLQRASRFYTERYLRQDKEVVDMELLKDLAHYAVFAKAAYGWKMDLALRGRLHMGDLRALLKQTGVDAKDVVATHWKSQTHRPACFLVRDRKRRKLVLCIRGTWGARDLLTDLCCTSATFETAGGKHRAHYGMLASARKVASITEQDIESELAAHPDFSLVVIGHSLGGGIAAVVGTLWEKRFPGVTVYAYGCPCVAPLDTKPTRSNSIVSVVGEGDPFSCLSLGHIADISSTISHICENEDLRTSILTRTKGPVEDLAKQDLIWCFDTMEKMRKRTNGHEKMYPPGRILYISKSNLDHDEKDSIALREVSPDFFRDLRLHSRMLDLSRHIPTLYESYLQRLWSEMDTKSSSKL